MLPRDFAISDRVGSRGVWAAVSVWRAFRRVLPGLRRAVAAGLAPVVAMGQVVVPVAITAGVAAAGSAVVAVSRPASARAVSQSVLILSTSVNGGSSSAEAAAVPSGVTVTVATPSTWDAMTTAQFGAYSAIVIGDPSTTSCASGVPSDALSTAATWGAAVTGNVAVIGTAPGFAGAAGTPLIKDSIAYALAGAGTGLYVSLNCEYASAAAGTAVPLLAGVDGGGFTVTGQGSACPDSGTVNTQEADAVTQFNGLASSALGPWASSACSVSETLNSWPAQFAGLAFDAAATPADFTASDGAVGQPYVLAGAPVSATTQALAPSTGGEVAAGATIGGANPAAPGVAQAAAGDPVNTANGDFTQSATDITVPTFGPGLDFTRTYDAKLAAQQTLAAAPGPLGYGWMDNWASSLATGRPVPGYLYSIDGSASQLGDGGAATAAPLNSPAGVFVQPGTSNVFIADSYVNRVQEIAGSTGTQWGIPMTAGDIYTVAGSATGTSGSSGDGGLATSALLNQPEGITMDASGNLYIADTDNNRIQKVAAGTGIISTVAGQANGNSGSAGDGGLATQAYLNFPVGVATGAGTSDLYIADAANHRIQEVPASSGTQWGQSRTAGDMYTIAGSATGNPGHTGDGGAASAALLDFPEGVSVSSAGDLYIADTDNSRIQEVPKASGTQWGNTTSWTANDMYTLAGSATGTSGDSGDGHAASGALLNYPAAVFSGSGQQLYVADSSNNQVREVARTGHAEWGQSMTTGDIYSVAGNPSGNSGFSGDGGAAGSALMNFPLSAGLDGSGNLFIADTLNNRVREVTAATDDMATAAGTGGTLGTGGNGGPGLSAAISDAKGVASDAAGNVYIADTGNSRVQEIAATSHTQWGIVMIAGDTYTVAGSATGVSGNSGDGGLATSALLSYPGGVAVDKAGDLFIADSYNDQVREVAAASGNITTVAGSTAGAAGTSGDGGPATSALLNIPAGVAVDAAGNVYIADDANNRVQEISAAGGTHWGQPMTVGDIYTVAGSAAGTVGSSGDGGATASARLHGPAGVAADASGNVYIGDAGNNRVQEMAAVSGPRLGQSMTAGDMYTVAGSPAGTYGFSGDGGPAAAALLASPESVAVDSSGDVFAADTYNNRVQEIAAVNGTQWGQSMTGGDIYTIAGSGTTWNQGSTGDGGLAGAALLDNPAGLGTDPSGSVYIADTGNNRIREVNATSAPVFPESPACTATAQAARPC
jgi:hypothetical protein